MGLPQNKRQPLYTEIDRRFRRSGVSICIHLTIDVSESETDRDANFGIFGVQMESHGAFQRITDVAPFLMDHITAANVEHFQFLPVDIPERPCVEDLVYGKIAVPAFNLIDMERRPESNPGALCTMPGEPSLCHVGSADPGRSFPHNAWRQACRKRETMIH